MGFLSFLVSLGHNCCTTSVWRHSPRRADSLLLSTCWPTQELTLSSRTTPTASDRDYISDLASYAHDNDSVRKKASVMTYLPNGSLFNFCFNMFRTLVLQGNLVPDHSPPIRVFLFTWYVFGIIMYGKCVCICLLFVCECVCVLKIKGRGHQSKLCVFYI